MVLPCETLCEAGVAATVKGVTTFNVTVALCVTPPFVPVIVSVYAPMAVVLVVAMLSAEEAEPVTDDGVKVGVAPAGNPLTLRLVVLPAGAVTFTV